jgi:ABC-2 type transport system permease protein
MTSKDDFEPVTETGWKMGFSTLLKKEMKAWFGTSAWLVQAILWSLILGLFGSVGIQDPEAGLAIFYMMATIFPSIATIIISHELIIEEKRSGSAAWILSKPVSRTAFIVTKFIRVALGFSVSMVFVPGFVIYLEFFAFGLAPDFLIYLLSLVPLAL